ncbi:hypothetical protein C1T06_22900 [Vibrio parahaemolyticus]|nr:hypothetical protein C1T06_22900 [Vibrio parahaemolyticus]
MKTNCSVLDGNIDDLADSLAGKIVMTIDDECGFCAHQDPDDDCSTCGGDITYKREILVGSDTIKSILTHLRAIA